MPSRPTTFKEWVQNYFLHYFSIIFRLLIAAVIVAFFWGIVRFIWASSHGDEKGIKSGKDLMLWGVIGIAVMFSVYGLVNFLISSTSLTSSMSQPPQVTPIQFN